MLHFTVYHMTQESQPVVLSSLDVVHDQIEWRSLDRS